MKRSELIEQLAAYLQLNQQVSDESAQGMKLLRLAYAELCKPADDDSQASDLKEQLTAADTAIQGLNDRVTDHEDILYDLLLQAGLVPEVDGELAISYGVAVKEDPECIEKLKSALAGGEVPEDAMRFISGVRGLLGLAYDVSLQEVFNTLTREAQRLNALDEGIAQRDKGLQNMESLINKVIEAVGIDWSEVESLPYHVKKFVDYAGDKRDAIASGAPTEEWLTECIDLAHAVRGDLSPENRVMAKAAEHIILTAPRGEA